MPQIIRLLNKNDAKAFSRLRLEALKNDPESFGSDYDKEVLFTLSDWQNRVENNQVGFSLGAFEGDTLVSFAGVILNTHRNIKHKAFIWGVYTTPQYRGKGLSKLVFADVIQQSRTIASLEMLQLDVGTHIKAAKTLYKKFGFTTYGVDVDAMRIHGKSIDLELMHLKL